MYILGIDSSTGRISVAVNSGRQLLSKVEYDKNQRYMVSIISLIDKALKKAGISLDVVDLFAVNIGPGDFTGTRIGISVSKTLAWVISKPICGVGSLDVTALGIFFKNFNKIQKLLAEGKQIIIAPVLDVKRNEVYFSFYKIKESVSSIKVNSRKNYDNKDEHPGFKIHTISNISIQNKNYCINKISCGYLAESKDFTKKFSSLFVPDNGFSSYILLGGSGFSIYKHLGPEVRELGDVDKRVFPPDAFHLNLCAYYSYLNNRQECLEKVKGTMLGNTEAPDYLMDAYRLAPLYVREFKPFKT
jgi:tRNA threonylcarbamoyl adenosine modification protein YeaZ